MAIVLGDTRRTGTKPLHLEPEENWFRLTNAYADWLGSNRWLPLGGRHRLHPRPVAQAVTDPAAVSARAGL